MTFLGHVRELAPEDAAPVIALTARSDAEERQKALKAGFARFLTKPAIQSSWFMKSVMCWNLTNRCAVGITAEFLPTATDLCSSMLVRLTCRPDRLTVVTRFPCDRRARHALPDECRGHVPARRLE
jgi:CheY-like chemotaxis protein